MTVLELEPPPPQVPTEAGEAALLAAADSPAFRYLRYYLHVMLASLQAEAQQRRPSDLYDVGYTQGLHRGLGVVERLLATAQNRPRGTERPARSLEENAFAQAKSLIEEIK